MGDRTAVFLLIGGALPRSAVPELVELIEAEGLGNDWDSREIGADDVEAAAAAGECLRVMDNETYASLDHLPAFMRQHGLHWRFCWDAYPGSFNAGAELADAEGETDYTTDGTDGAPLLTGKEVRDLGSYEAIIQRLERLERATPPLVLT